MPVFLSRIPFRESRGLILVCAAAFAVMLAVALRWPEPVKEERAIARKQSEVAALKARGESVPTSAYPKVEHYVAVWLRKGWLINTAIAGAMLLVSPWLGRRIGAEMEFLAPSPRSSGAERSLTAVGCIVIMGFAAWQNFPRLFLSMWGDEEFNASRFIVDEVSRKDDDSIEIRPRPWSATLWSFRKTTNHLGFSALARLSHDTFFKKKTGPSDPWFSEALIRLPVYVAGLLFIPAMLWCGRVWGVPTWLGVVLASLHPWFVRFGVDGRGYGLVLLSVPLLLGFLRCGLQTAQWRWWLLFGIAQAFVFWCYFGSIYLLVALNLTALGLIFTGTGDARAKWLLFSRWLVSGVIAKMLIIGVMAPCWPQLFEFLDQKPMSGRLDGPWCKNVLSEMFLGTPWSRADAGNDLMPSLSDDRGYGALLVLAITVLVAVAGAIRLARRTQSRWLLLFILGAPGIMLAHMAWSGIRPYSWYLVPYSPGLILLWSSGMRLAKPEAPVDAVDFRRARVRAGVSLILILPFALVTEKARETYRTHPIEPSRESVALYRKVTNPRNPEIERDVISGGFVFYTEGYDPALRRFKDAAGLRDLMAEAGRSHRQLFINTGMIEFARAYGFAEVCAMLDDPAQFEHVATLTGLLPSTTREVYRWKPRSP